jgi:hypothetical protein
VEWSYNTPVVSSDNQTAAGNAKEIAVEGGGTFTGLAPRAVVEVKSTIASPE